MRPSLSEQIEGARQVLLELVDRQDTDPYLQEQVTYAAAALEQAAARWPHVLPDLVADIRELEEVLGVEHGPLEEDEPGVPDLAAAEEYHRELRSRLTDDIKSGSELSSAVRAYLSDSIERLK